MTSSIRTSFSELDLHLRQYPDFDQGREDGRFLAWALGVGLPVPTELGNVDDAESALRYFNDRLSLMLPFSQTHDVAAWAYGVIEELGRIVSSERGDTAPDAHLDDCEVEVGVFGDAGERWED